MKKNSVFKPIIVFDSTQVYYAFENIDESIISRMVVMQNGQVKYFSWSERRNEWVDIATMQQNNCDNYGICGSYGVCSMNTLQTCTCPSGFRPSSEQDWERFDWLGGCVRKLALNCSAPQGFRKFTNWKLPDSSLFLVNKTVKNLVECKETCLRNCSCMAYAETEASGCVIWFKDLLDITEYKEGAQDLYIRLDASQLGSSDNGRRKAVIASFSVISGVLLLGLISWYIYRRRAAKRIGGIRLDIKAADEENLELLIFNMVTIAEATHNFSYSNKIGEGGFGPVYKGMLSSGRKIAVKRLSLTSGQGVNEFKNEVTLIAKLQHRNLVRLLGCCIQGDEKMLVYEYMPNGSLDSFIFDDSRSNFLGWNGRYDVIIGISRGLLSLHRDSRLRIIHRDLKASNVLLDSDMNPKISDFGTARAFGADQNLAKTKKVVGTYGYMSPEYAIDGIFSVKSDVFSFGVLVLEIVSGKRNRQFRHPDHDLNLLGHAWKLWTEGKAFDLLHPLMVDMVSFSEVAKCVQVGLLCVQHRPEDRPTMSSVVSLLDSVSAILPQPKHPGFYTERTSDADEKSEVDEIILMTNVLTNTLSKGR